MAVDMPPRGPLTDLLIEHLEQDDSLTNAGIVVGDNTRPPAAGWSGTQPGQGQFVASVGVDTGEAGPGFRETIGARHSSWVMTYHLQVTGGTRTQVDHAADKVRAAVLSFPKGPYVDGWQVTYTVMQRQAPVRKDTPTDHPSFHIDDVVQIQVDRTRS